MKIRRLKIRRVAETDSYTAKGLADCFGIDMHAVVRWIKQGLLKAEIINEKSNGQPYYLIEEKAVKDFILKNPLVFDLRKVDQLWFMDLITDGKIIV